MSSNAESRNSRPPVLDLGIRQSGEKFGMWIPGFCAVTSLLCRLGSGLEIRW